MYARLCRPRDADGCCCDAGRFCPHTMRKVHTSSTYPLSPTCCCCCCCCYPHIKTVPISLLSTSICPYQANARRSQFPWPHANRPLKKKTDPRGLSRAIKSENKHLSSSPVLTEKLLSNPTPHHKAHGVDPGAADSWFVPAVGPHRKRRPLGGRDQHASHQRHPER